MDTIDNTSVHQLILSNNTLPHTLVTCWSAWVLLLNFGVKHVPRVMNVGPDGISWQLQGEGEPKPEEENNPENTIEANVQ